MLILIPGHLCDHRLYAPQIAEFDDVHVADVTRDDDIGAMADRVLANAPDRFDLGGLSMGGMVAMEVMARAPERVRSACLMATDPTAARDKEKEWRAGQQAAVRASGLAAFSEPFQAMFFAHDPSVGERLSETVAQMSDATDEATYHRQSAALNGRRAMLEHLDRCTMPVEVIVGTEDRICPPKLHESLAQALPAARLTQIEGCGHLVSLERPDIVNSALRRVL
ncbi:alpha/beta fold hydrolase [Pontivivens nitratireducens]|uniref:alpha/beta fold hydrolase n=1 Tax=Pontivivens nitratireducens TaxID=2758038 RepID=UPI00163AE7E1|nr:alpha/beta fold hydrolase [Pontibrevibacter nitratireducens]